MCFLINHNYGEYKSIVHDLSERHYIKPFALLGKEANLEISEGFLVKHIEEEMIKANIYKNLSDFEYDEKNYGKYVFLKKEMENR